MISRCSIQIYSRNLQNGVRKPANMELHPSLSSFDVSGIAPIPRLVVVSIQGDTNLPLLRWSKIVIVCGDCASMAHDQGLADNPWFRCSVALSRLLVYAAPPGSVASSPIALNDSLVELRMVQGYKLTKIETIHGSLMVIQFLTRSPNRS